jgi:peptidoglycan/LPS O-acetylase OafA/YrhL
VNKPFSLYLDLVRFAASCLVYMYHSNQRWLVEQPLPASHYGHSSVIVFFVLSGFVIAYVTERKENNCVSYLASRASRVYSVALPAVLLTLVLDAAGRSLAPAIYAYPFDQFVVRSAASLLLLNEWWFVSITSFSNVPYWSICYEAWYYVAFAIVSFAPTRVALVALPALALLVGPKIVLLAPLWVAGVVLYRWQRLQALSMPLSWGLAIGAALGIVAFHVAGVGEAASAWFEARIGKDAYTQLTFSKFFIGDYLLGLLVMLHFAGMRRVAGALDVLLRPIERPVRYLARYTFTLYLLHQPLFLFWGAVLRGDPRGTGTWWLVTALSAASVLVIGHFTESRRHLLTPWIARQLQRVADLRLKPRHATVD